MLKEKQDALYNKYPSLFVQKDLSKQESCMYWGCDCGIGWANLLDETCSKIMEIDKNKEVQFCQIKEKFAGLRIYFECTNEDLSSKVQKILIDAEDKSNTICEQCGEPGKVYTDGWHRTLCLKCKSTPTNSLTHEGEDKKES